LDFQQAIELGLLKERETPQTDLEKAHQMMSAEKPITAQLKDVFEILTQKKFDNPIPALTRKTPDISTLDKSPLKPEESSKWLDFILDNVDLVSGMTKAFHGTPNRVLFGKFDKKFIGSGEGGAARGWGFYLSDVRDIGETYAKLKSKKGKNIEPGYIYRATLHPHKEQENWLDWDEKVTNEQLNNIVKQAKIENISEKIESKLDYYNNSVLGNPYYAGSTVYHWLKNIFGSKKAASEFLDRAGIDGIRFEAGSIMGVKPRVVERKIENISDEQADVILKELKQIPKREYGENIGFGKGKEGLMKYTKDYPSLINEIMVKHGFSNQQYNYVIFNPEHIQVDAVEEVSGKVVKEFVPNNP